MKPNKRIIEKLKILSELSYDNQVGISEKGNYFVRLTGPSKVDTSVELRPHTITRGTYDKMFVKRQIKYEVHQNMLLLTKTGKVKIGTPLRQAHGFRKGCAWTTINTSNFHKHGRWLNITGKDSDEVKSNIFKLVFCNSKAKWLMDMPFYTLYRGLEYRILLNYSSLNDMKKDLGYQFLSDKAFYNLLLHVEHINIDPFDKSKGTMLANKGYLSNLFAIVLFGKSFSLKSRKNLVIALLNLFATKADKEVDTILDELYSDFTHYIKKKKNEGGDYIELASDIKSIVTDLTREIANGSSNRTKSSDDDADEDLPF